MSREDRERELDDEIRSHLAHEADSNVERGMRTAGAEAAARRAFGPALRASEHTRAEWRFHAVHTFWRDVRHGFRMAVRDRAFTFAALLSLAAGIGANVAIFSVVNALLLRPLPYADPDRLAEISQRHETMPAGYKLGSSPEDLADWRASGGPVEDFATWEWAQHYTNSGGDPEYLWGGAVSEGFFRVLGTRPMLGRTLQADDFAERRRVVVLSHRLWSTRFGADPGIVGRTITLGSRDYDVVGVMPPRFEYPPYSSSVPGMRVSLWQPAADRHRGRGDRNATPVIRVREGHSMARAEAEIQAVAARLAESHPDTNAGWTASVTPLTQITNGSTATPLALLTAAAGFLLLIACVNVTNLLLARSAARWRDTALRVALGASRTRLFLQAAAENASVALAGGVVGAAAAYWSLRALTPLFPNFVSRFDQVSVDGVALAVAFVISASAAVVIAAGPALWFAPADPAVVLQSGAPVSTRTAARVGRVLVAGQLAASAMLLAGALLASRTVASMQRSELGFDASHVLTARIAAPKHLYRSWDSVRMLHEGVLEQTKSIPGVESAALVMTLPFTGRSTQYSVSTAEGSRTTAERNVVSAGYFDVMRLKPRDGVVFTATDEAPRAVVNRALVRELWPDGRAVGKEVRVGGDAFAVAGVVDDEKQLSINYPAPPKAYLSYGRVSDTGARGLLSILAFVVARTSTDPTAFAGPMRAAVRRMQSGAPFTEVKAMEQLVADSVAVPRLTSLLLSALGVLALAVSAAGLYGVSAYGAARRTRDIGVRVAMGATRAAILRQMLGEGMVTALVGGVAGVAASVALTVGLRAMVPGLVTLDPWAFGGALAVLMAASALACLGPAWRASRADPLDALRHP